MAKINKDEYEVLKELDSKWKWIARDIDRLLFVFNVKPRKGIIHNVWDIAGWDDDYLEIEDSDLFQFIKWEDEKAYNIDELIEEYENSLIKSTPWTPSPLDFESEETEVKDIKDVIEYIETSINFIEERLPKKNRKKPEDNKEWYEGYLVSLKQVKNKLDRLDEPEPKNISLQDVTQRLWELPSNNRKDWLEQLNVEFQEGYIVPLGLKTTDGEEQYLTFNDSYFACRRNRDLQQTFATLEEIPEFYRDLAERVL